MINIRQNTVVTNQTQEELISKLKWKLHLFYNPYFVSTTFLRDKTNKPFAGYIEENMSRFYIKRVRPLHDFFLPVFLVKGEIIKYKGQTNLRLKFRLGILSSIFFLYLIFGVFLFMRLLLFSGLQNIESLVWFLFPILFVWFGIVEIKKIEKQLLEIFEIELPASSTCKRKKIH